MKVARIVSGGQTGADRAALDAAVAAGVPYSGWCPRGGWAEDLTEPPGLLACYPSLRETPTADRETRTRWNVRDSDATLVLLPRPAESPGTALTVRTAVELERPHLVTPAAGSLDAILAWLDTCGTHLRLNVAGPRESEAPGLYPAAYTVVRALLTRG